MRWILVATLLNLCACSVNRAAPVRWVAELSENREVFRAHFIDIGQGLSVLLEFPCAAVLVDAGGEYNDEFDSVRVLEGYLDRFFETRPDLDRTLALVLVTHPHVDHTRGLPRLRERYRILNVVDNGMSRGSGGRQQTSFRQWARTNPDVGYRAVSVGDIYDPEGISDEVIDPVQCRGINPELRVLWGRLERDPGWGGNRWGKTRFQNANNHSVVLRVDFGKASALFAGDLEPPAIRELLRRSAGALDVDLYQVAHHGSKNGTTPALVAAMSPEIAVFATGPEDRQLQWTAWRYGHPRASVLDMLERGITRTRTPVDVLVGTGGRRFVSRRVTRAVYASGWDGTIVAEATRQGVWRVFTSGRGTPTDL